MVGKTGKLDHLLVGIFVFGLSLRLINIEEPLIDEQAWRQTDTAAMARNYFEEGYDLFYPRVDWRGDTEGFVESNFPAYAFLVACLYALLGGAEEWVGHLVSALFSASSVIVLYALANRFYGLQVARLSSFFFVIAPLNVFFGRAFMPEAAMIFFSIGAIYFFVRWMDSDRWVLFFAAFGCAALAFLIKIPTLYLGLPILFLAHHRFGRGIFAQPKIWAYAFLSLLPPFLWHWHAYSLFEQTHLTFGIWNSYGYDKWGNFGILATGEFYWKILSRLMGVVFTPLGFALLVFGVCLGIESKRELVFHTWMLALVIYVLLVPEGNKTLSYYQLPFVPVGSIFVGRALGRLLGAGRGLKRLAAFSSLPVLCVLSYFYTSPLYLPKPYNVVRYEIGKQIDALVPKDALLVVGDIDANVGARYRTQSPTFLYYCKRKGWQLTPDEFQAERLRALRRRGARYFVVPTEALSDVRQASMSITVYDAAGREIAQLARSDEGAPRFPLLRNLLDKL